MKEWTNVKIALVVLLSVYTLLTQSRFVLKYFKPMPYLTLYITTLIVSIVSHMKVNSRFFKSFKFGVSKWHKHTQQ